jgi:hypothetical protein
VRRERSRDGVRRDGKGRSSRGWVGGRLFVVVLRWRGEERGKPRRERSAGHTSGMEAEVGRKIRRKRTGEAPGRWGKGAESADSLVVTEEHGALVRVKGRRKRGEAKGSRPHPIPELPPRGKGLEEGERVLAGRRI